MAAMIHAQDPSVQTFTLEAGNRPPTALPIYETASRALVKTINDALGDASLPESQLNDSFDTYWPRLKQALEKLPNPEGQITRRREPEEMLEEILDIVRGLARDRYEEEDYEHYPSSNPAEMRQQFINLMETLQGNIAKAQAAKRAEKDTEAPNPGAAPDDNRATRRRRR